MKSVNQKLVKIVAGIDLAGWARIRSYMLTNNIQENNDNKFNEANDIYVRRKRQGILKCFFATNINKAGFWLSIKLIDKTHNHIRFSKLITVDS